MKFNNQSLIKSSFKLGLCGFASLLMSLSLSVTDALATSFQLETSGHEPLYQTSLSNDVYAHSRSNALQDLTIHNASGEQVPYALLPYTALYQQTSNSIETKPLLLFPIAETSLNNPDALRIQLEKSHTKTIVNIGTNDVSDTNAVTNTIYLIDAGAKQPALKQLSVQWLGAEDQFIPLEILASHDLKSWSHIGNTVLLQTTQAGNRILNNNITLDNSTEARYLQIRLSEPKKTPAFKLTAVNAEYHRQQAAMLPFLWQELSLITRSQDHKAGLINVIYEASGRYPASRVQIKLSQTNTITNVSISVRNKTNEPWIYLTNASLYRITQQDKTVSNPDLILNPKVARYWQLQFNQASGGIGAESPTLTIGWLPETVIWNARGNVPFTLKVGENPSAINTISVASLLPGFKTEHDFDWGKVKQLPISELVAVKPDKDSTKNISVNTWTSPVDYKSWLLWGGLLGGVLMLAAMAYSLLKSSNKK